VIENMFDQEDHCERLSKATLFQRGHGLVTSMLAIVTNKVLAAYYFSKEDVMAISTFKKLNEAQQFKSARRPHEGGEYSAEVAASLHYQGVGGSGGQEHTDDSDGVCCWRRGVRPGCK